MSAGYSGTPLAKKLGYKPGYAYYWLNPPEKYDQQLADMPEDAFHALDPSPESIDLVHGFAKTEAELEEIFKEGMQMMKQSGMIWVSWPKKSSGVETEINDAIVRGKGRELGMIDVKVCAVDNIWSGQKFMIRVKDRK